MADPISVISLVEGSIGLVLQCGTVAKTLSDMIAKFKHAEVAITSMIQEVETIQFAWNRIKEWSEEHAEAATDSSFVQRLEKSLRCGALVLSALEQDLADYKHTADNASFVLRSKMAWNERAFLDHQHRVRGQVQAMTLMLQVSQLSTSKAQTKLLDKKEKVLRASDESAYSIVPSRMSSHMSVSIRSRDSVSSIESKELVYYPLSFEDDLFTARVYKRNYRSPWVNTLSKLYWGKGTEERRVLGVKLKASEKGPLLPSSSTGTTKTRTTSVDFSQPLRSNQEVSLRDPRPVPTSPAAATESDPTDRSVTTLDSIPPTSEEALSIGLGLQNGATNLNKLYPAEGQPNVLGAIDPASGHFPQIDNESNVAVTRPSLTPEAQYEIDLSLLRAVNKGNLDKVKTLIDQGADVNAQDVYSRTPLDLAIFKHNVSMTATLLQKGANCAQKSLGTPPIHQACIQGDIQIARLLLDAGASASSLNAQNEQPLHVVQSSRLNASDLIDLLINRGADVNARTRTNETPLHLSCKDPIFDNVRALLIHGANPNSICEGGKVAMHILAKTVVRSTHIYKDIPGIFRLLHNHGADVSAEDKLGDTPLHLLAERGYRCSAKHWDERVAIFRFLLRHGTNMTARNGVGNTPLHLVVTEWNDTSRSTILKGILQLSFRYGVNLNAQDKTGDTPLHILVTCLQKSEAFIQLLLQHGVNVNVQNKVGDTPLHILVGQPLYRRHDWREIKAISQLLLQHGADVNIRNKAGETPLHTLVAAYSKEFSDGIGCQAAVQLLLKHRVNVDAQNLAGDTPLHIMFKQGLKQGHRWSEHIFQSLIDHGAQVGIQNIAGDTPLDIIVRGGYSLRRNAVVEKIN